MEEVIHPVEEVIHTLVILESAQGPNPSFFLFIRLLFNLGACWDQDLDQGLTIIPREFGVGDISFSGQL